MQKNAGTVDGAVRLIVAVVAAFLAVSASGAMAVVWWVVAVVMLLTAAVGFCPLYTLFGLNTCKR